jgi:tetratricopeptide (TPR) repeat protein
LAELQASLKADPRSAGSYYFLGVAQNALGFPSQAKSSWAHALELHPRMHSAQLALAELDANTGEYDEALRLAGDVLIYDQSSSPAQLVRAKALLAKGQTKEGEALLQAVLERNPISLPALTMLVKVRISEKRSQDILPRISKLVDQYPQNGGLHYLLAALYFSLNELVKAEASAKHAIVLGRPGPDGYTLLAYIHGAQGSVDKAKADFQAAIEGNPRNITNYLALEGLYESEGKWEQAKKLCEKAREVDPDSPLVANNLAYLYLEHGGDVNVALSLAELAKQKMPDSPGVADTLGWVYYKLGSPQSAIVQLKECVLKGPRNPLYQYHLGMAYMAAGNLDSAERSLQQALRNDPNFPYAASARTALAKISKERVAVNGPKG